MRMVKKNHADDWIIKTIKYKTRADVMSIPTHTHKHIHAGRIFSSASKYTYSFICVEVNDCDSNHTNVP